MRHVSRLAAAVLLAYVSLIAAFSSEVSGMESKSKDGVIRLVPIGRVPDDLQGWLSQSAEKAVPYKFVVEKPVPVPEQAYDPHRKQYKGESLLTSLSKLEDGKFERILGLIDADCYSNGLNFIFGQASLNGRVAVVALPRLRQSYYHLPENPQLFRERALKEVVHELGHTWNLPHCPDPLCVMHFSNSLPDTDKKEYRFCSLCRRRLKWK